MPLAWKGLCDGLRESKDHLIELSDRAGDFYSPFDMRPTPESKWRHIDNPVNELKRVHKKIKKWLEKECDPHPNLHGGVRGKSTVSAAEVHLGAPILLTLDIGNYFPSIGNKAAFDFFMKSTGCIPDVARCLTILTTLHGHLPHGAPTSMILANLVNRPMFDRLGQHVEKFGCDMSIYVDDVSVSGDRAEKCIDGMIAIIRDFGFVVRRDKIKKMCDHGEQSVLGIKVNTAIGLPWKKRTEIAKHIALIWDSGEIRTRERGYLKKLGVYIRGVDPQFAAAFDNATSREIREVDGTTLRFKPMFEHHNCDLVKCLASHG